MLRWTWIILSLVALGCTPKHAAKPGQAGSEAFFTAKSAWCTVELAGKPKTNSIERYEEVFVFKKDGSLAVVGYDLDAKNRIQLNGKGQPKLKTVESAKFRIEGAKLFMAATDERVADFERAPREKGGLMLECFRLTAVNGSSLHCPCELPGDEK